MAEDFASRSNALKNRCSRLAQLLNLFLENHADTMNENIQKEYRRSIDDIVRLSNSLKPFYIGVTGLVATGKSTLLNKLLDTPNLLRASTGRTTTIPCFISHGLSHRVTVSYFSCAEIEDDLKEIVNTPLEIRRTDDHIKGLIGKLSKLFKDFATLAYGTMNPEGELQPNHNGLLAKVGHADISNGFSDLPAAMSYCTSIVESEGAVISRIQIQGPFPLHPGITICDTPGLGDAVADNSERTRSLLDEMNECWQVTETTRCLATADEQRMTRDMMRNHRTLRMVGTKSHAGLEPFEAGQSVRLFRDNLLLAHCEGKTPVSMSAEERQHWEEVRSSVEQQVDAIPLAFTEFQGGLTFGLDTCKQWLQELGNGRSEALDAAEREFEILLKRIRELGIGDEKVPPYATELQRWRDDVVRACADFLTKFREMKDSAVLEKAYRNMQNRGGWCGDQRSVRAVMRKYGVHEASDGTLYDFTGDFVREWQEMTELYRDGIVTIFNNATWSLQAIAADSPLVNALIASLWEIRTQLLESCFDRLLREQSTYLLRQYYLNHSKWYDDKRKKEIYSFKENEIVTALGKLCECVRYYIGTLERHVEDITSRLLTPVRFDEIPGLREEFEAMINTLELPEPIHADGRPMATMVEPVGLECGHCFERNYIEQWFQKRSNCPKCKRTISQTFIIRYDLIARQRFHPTPGVVPDNWWIGLWRRVVLEVINRQEADNLDEAGSEQAREEL